MRAAFDIFQIGNPYFKGIVEGHGPLGHTLIVTPHHHRVGGVGADKSHLNVLCQREDPVVFQKDKTLAGHVKRLGLMLLGAKDGLGNTIPGRLEIHLAKSETDSQEPFHMYVKISFREQSLRDRRWKKVCHVAALDIHSSQGRSCDSLLPGLCPVVELLSHKIGDSPAVADYQALVAPFLSEDVLQEPLGSTAGITFETVVGEHDFLHPCLSDKILESGEIGLPKIPFGDIGVKGVPR